MFLVFHMYVDSADSNNSQQTSKLEVCNDSALCKDCLLDIDVQLAGATGMHGSCCCER